ncbi:M20 aminoacylase family protein [Roseomonas xinghualingensis]|uniref:M20 aminoacylase family protein n=1 Tax=Roseomonas xinghualingensis TaxID=2986475 RepID=UPI0021F17EAA|nr:M20 aminoacylase family protein [Roseomonas sp. SXEYE001]MCV4207460.1 M20 family metallopeptidase [Roseomonas sp. SXEYE001]
MPTLAAIEALRPEMQEWRRDFHAHPETGFQEIRTSGIVAGKLESWGIEVHRGLGKTGVVGVLRGKRPGNRSIGLRADMDALPMPELNDFAHRSTNPNAMHACGHDGHTAMLLGAARHLAETRDFPGTVHFIFQPAEEGLTGALEMVKDGLFTRFPCDTVYGLHNHPSMPLGTIAIRPGTVLAAVDYFSIRLFGKSSHGAEPHNGLDPLPCAVQIYNALQTLISRRTDPHDTAVLSIGQFHAGTSDIVLPEMVELRGTIRTLRPETHDRLSALFRQVVESTAAAHGVRLELDLNYSYPPTINTPAQAALAAEAAADVVGAAGIKADLPSLTAGEDFAYMLQEAPGGFLLLGQAGESETSRTPVHNGRYDFNDDLLPIGASCLVRLVERELAGA